jgi:hypothetical protein
LHCGKNGELGIPKLENTTTALKMGLKFQLNSDPAMKAVFEELGLKKKLEDTAGATWMNWPIKRIGQIQKPPEGTRDQGMGPTNITGKSGSSLRRRQDRKRLAHEPDDL